MSTLQGREAREHPQKVAGAKFVAARCSTPPDSPLFCPFAHDRGRPRTPAALSTAWPGARIYCDTSAIHGRNFSRVFTRGEMFRLEIDSAGFSWREHDSTRRKLW